MSTLASIDIGSQTIRLLVARCDGHGRLVPLHKDRCIVRLGEELHATGMIQENAILRAVDCIKGYVLQARAHGAAEISMVATAFARQAANAHLFLARVAGAADIMPQVISGAAEARPCSLGGAA